MRFVALEAMKVYILPLMAPVFFHSFVILNSESCLKLGKKKKNFICSDSQRAREIECGNFLENIMNLLKHSNSMILCLFWYMYLVFSL